jgi:hypothetical protein
VILALAACSVLQIMLARLAIKPDSWYTLLAGREIARSGLPHHDTLTVIAHGRDWVDQQWLSQLAGYGLWSVGRWPLALAGNSLAYLAAFGVLAAAARRCGATERSTALVVPICFIVGLSNTAFRAQIPAYLLFATVILLLLLDELRPSRRVYLVLPLLVIWANVHGSVVLGAALVALRGVVLAVGRLRSRTPPRAWAIRAALLTLVPWLCIFVSPYALGLPSYYRKVLWNPEFSKLVGEWGPATARSQPIFYVLLFAALWLTSRAHRSLGPFARLALLATGIAGLVAVRNIVWFALAAAAIVPLALDNLWRPTEAPRRRAANLVLASLSAIAVVVALGLMAAHTKEWFEQNYPAGVARAVAASAAADPRRTVFATDLDADWLLFKEPALAGRVAFDTRFELLTSPELRRLAAFLRQGGPNWRRAADGYSILVLNTEEGPPARAVTGPRGRILASSRGTVAVLRPAAS